MKRLKSGEYKNFVGKCVKLSSNAIPSFYKIKVKANGGINKFMVCELYTPFGKTIKVCYTSGNMVGKPAYDINSVAWLDYTEPYDSNLKKLRKVVME